MTDVDPEDVTAMRKQGDLRAFMRAQIAEGAARRTAKPQPVETRAPGHRPGAWPPGTRPPGPPPDIPAAVVQAAIEEHRAWRSAGSPPGQYRCHCQPCQSIEGA